MERTKMPNLRNGNKEGFEPGITWLRVRHSTSELPRSTCSTYVDGSCGMTDDSRVFYVCWWFVWFDRWYSGVLRMLMVRVVRHMICGRSTTYIDGSCCTTEWYSGVLHMLMVRVVRHMIHGRSTYVNGSCGTTDDTRVFYVCWWFVWYDILYSGVLRMLMVRVVRQMIFGRSTYVDGPCGTTNDTCAFYVCWWSVWYDRWYLCVLRMLMVRVVRHMILGCSTYVDGSCGTQMILGCSTYVDGPCGTT